MNERMDEHRDLLMRALDGELDAEQRAAFDARLETNPELREEWRRLSRAREVTMGLKLRNPPEEAWDAYWTSVYSRAERGVGWLLFSVGAIVVGSWGAWMWLTSVMQDSTLPLVVRYGVIAIFVGLVILLVAAARHRFNVWRTDPYKEIER